MKKEFTTERRSETRVFIQFTEPNDKGETIAADLVKVVFDLSDPRALPNLWKKAGYINEPLADYWSVETYATDADGNCYGRYNPQTIPGENKINFAWILAATKENFDKIINEVYRLATA